jgi:hypothetical protein
MAASKLMWKAPLSNVMGQKVWTAQMDRTPKKT